jgi:hypothetical protein
MRNKIVILPRLDNEKVNISVNEFQLIIKKIKVFFLSFFLLEKSRQVLVRKKYSSYFYVFLIY